MKFVCDRCQTKYSIADDKVRGKVLKVRCKTCQNVITVREVGVRPSVEGLAPVRPTQRPSGPVASLGSDNDLEDRSERTMLTSAPAALLADLAQPRRATPPPPPPVGDGIEWFLALEGAQQGPFSRKLLVDKLLLLPRDADVHVWNDRMDGWKPPADVPDVGRDLAARRAPPVPMRPPLPRTTPSPPLPPTAARRGTMPLGSGLGGHKLPAPSFAASLAHAVPAPTGAVDEPLAAHHSAPVPTALAHGLGHASGAAAAVKTNGFAAHTVAPATSLVGGDSDALSALNLGGASGKAARQSGAAFPVAAPRIMEVGEATAWSGQGRVVEGRHRGTKMMVISMLVVAAMIVILAINFTKKAPVVTAAPPPLKTGVDSESLGKLAETAAHEAANEAANAGKPTPATEPSAPTAAADAMSTKARGSHGRPVHGGRAVAAHAATTPGAVAGTSPAAAPAEDPNASRFREGERKVSPTSGVSNRPAPSQGDIARVIANNRIGIKTCYQRALLRDSSLTHGKIVVGVTIGLSGRVKHVTVDGPPSFRALDPCIKEMTARWVFPQSYEEYGTEFSYVFQGNE
jgi:predicted Zn finger-like uncharacterized protein